MKKRYSQWLRTSIAGLALLAAPAFAQSYDNQKMLEDELRASARELTFLDFVSESSWGQTSRCQLRYRVASTENPYKAGDAQAVQGSITSDYYKDKPINFVLNLQPLRLDVNEAERRASSKTLNPTRAVLRINGLDLGKYLLETSICDGSPCFIYAPTKGEEILDMIKAVKSKAIFDAEISYSLDKAFTEKTLRLSNISTHGITNSEVRAQFTNCLSELVNKEIGDIEKVGGARK
jgi:hypothetical protein